jgi:Domain of unknown function (DUF3427)/Type III restriction enzyme, res subunit
MATGLGKTWLAAFDSKRPRYRRILFVAHRDEILQQSLRTFRAIRPEARLGLYTATNKDKDKDVSEVKALPREDRTLSRFLAATGLELEDLYRRGWTWAGLLRAAGHLTSDPGPSEPELSRGLGRLLHLDDPQWLSCLQGVSASPKPPDVAAMQPDEQRILTALHFSLWSERAARRTPLQASFGLLWRHPAVLDELRQLLDILEDRASVVPIPLSKALEWTLPVPLSVHSRYRLDDVLSAFGLMTPDTPNRIREGVTFDETSKSDICFVTLDKSEKHYSPTTRYRDYAISPDLFHWETQSTTSVQSRTGQRYLKHREQGTHILLFARQARTDAGQTQPYVFLGPADYESHRGDRPIAIVWRLRTPMPPELFQQARVAAG